MSRKSAGKKSPVRFEAVVPALVVTAVVGIYFHFFFDLNLRQGLEWVGFEIIGAEVNIAKIETHFFQGTFELHDLAITNPDKPSHNIVEIGEIRFGVLWDGLLRARLIVDRMTIEQIAIDTLRKKPGRIKLPESEKSTKAGSENQEIKQIAGILSEGGALPSQAEIEKGLVSKAMFGALQSDLDAKSKKWNEKLKTLPQNKEIAEINARLNKIKSNNFQNAQEVLKSIQELGQVINDANTKYKGVADLANEFNSDLNSVGKQLDAANEQVKKDSANLQSQLHLPSLDSQSLLDAFLQQYIRSTLGKFSRYAGWLQKLTPAASGKKNSTNSPDLSLQAHARSHGTIYEFGEAHAYPLFWIHQILISSKPGAGPEFGDLSGEILDVSSNQLLTEKPTTLKLEGGFPGLGIEGVQFVATIDNRQIDSQADFKLIVANMRVEDRDLVASPDVKVAVQRAQGSVHCDGHLVNFQDLNFKLQSSLQSISYNISASNLLLNELLKSIFAGIPVITMQITGKGPLPGVPLHIDANLGPALQAGLNKPLASKVAALQNSLASAIGAQVSPQQTKIQNQINQLKGQGGNQFSEVENQLNKERIQAQGKLNQSQKGSLEEQGKKALDDIRKAFGI